MASVGHYEEQIPAHCEIHGEYECTKTTYTMFSPHYSICQECEQDNERKELAAQQAKDHAEKVYKIQSRLKRACIPLRFEGASFDTYREYSGEIKDKKNKCVEFAKTFSGGTSLILCGNTGTGKTHLALSVLKYAIQQRSMTGKYIRTSKMIDEVKETYNKSSVERKSEVIERFVAPELLVLDEIGVQHGTDTEKMILFEILNERYENVKSTIVIGNLDLPGLTEYMGERVIDRMKENGGMVIAFTWESKRA